MRLRSDRSSILWFSQNHYYLVFFWSVGMTVDILQSRVCGSGRTGFDIGERYDNNYNYLYETYTAVLKILLFPTFSDNYFLGTSVGFFIIILSVDPV